MERRTFFQGIAALGVLGAAGPLRNVAQAAVAQAAPESVENLPRLNGALTVYMGTGEGGLYTDVMNAIRERNPGLELAVRQAPAASHANTLTQEKKLGGARADLFWSIDAGSLGVVLAEGMAKPVPQTLHALVNPALRYPGLVPLTGRIRTVVYNPRRIDPAKLPTSVMAYAKSDLTVGWAPAYAAFQSFLTAMRVLEGEEATRAWVQAIKPRAKQFAGELGAVMAVERGEVDVAFANHYYTLRLKQGKPNAPVAIAMTRDDAGSLMNTSGLLLLRQGELQVNFLRYLLSREVQSWLAREAYEIPVVRDVATPVGLPPQAEMHPPKLDLTRLADLRPTLDLLRATRVL